LGILNELKLIRWVIWNIINYKTELEQNSELEKSCT